MRSAALVAACALGVSACGGGERPAAPAAPTATPRTATPAPTRAAAPLRAPRCRAGVPKCARASGRIVYVERVDPDGDGDLHVVIADRGGVTLPGLTGIDISKQLRPARDPRIGDLAAAMGPVQLGSYRQPQIHALTLRVRLR